MKLRTRSRCAFRRSVDNSPSPNSMPETRTGSTPWSDLNSPATTAGWDRLSLRLVPAARGRRGCRPIAGRRAVASFRRIGAPLPASRQFPFDLIDLFREERLDDDEEVGPDPPRLADRVHLVPEPLHEQSQIQRRVAVDLYDRG